MCTRDISRHVPAVVLTSLTDDDDDDGAGRRSTEWSRKGQVNKDRERQDLRERLTNLSARLTVGVPVAVLSKQSYRFVCIVRERGACCYRGLSRRRRHIRID